MEQSTKQKMFKRQRGLCSICHEPMNRFVGDGTTQPHDNDMTIEHRISRWEGNGKRRNVALAHYKCNWQRGADEQARQPYLEVFYRGFAGAAGVPHCLRRTPIM